MCVCVCRSLADKDSDGKFTFPEFTIAMHLVFLAKVGFLLPVNLEPSTVLPAGVSLNNYQQTFVIL